MEVTRFFVTNPMPEYVTDNEDLMRRFHEIGASDPLKSGSDFVNYFFQTLTVWIICTTEILKSVSFVISETVNEFIREDGNPKREFTEWSKGAAYYTWVSLCLPFIFMMGYASEDIRKPFFNDVSCESEENAKKKVRSLEKAQEVLKGQYDQVLREKGIHKDRLDVLDSECKRVSDATGGDVGVHISLVDAKLLMIHRVQEARGVSMQQCEDQLRTLRDDYTAQIEQLAQDKDGLGTENAAQKEELIRQEKELQAVGQPGMRRLLTVISAHQRSNRGSDLTFTVAELNRHLPLADEADA